MGHLAIIGGTGLERLPPEFVVEPIHVETPSGTAVAALARRKGEEFIFLPRHGEAHQIAPHQIHYRANIAALRQLGVTRILATNAVGSLRPDLLPGSLVLFSDFIDFTRHRPLSFWDGIPSVEASVVHTDFSVPYCPDLRRAVQQAASSQQMQLRPVGVYLCTDGPRFETPAEVRLFAQWGADVVGMTGLPEAIFAREAGICYAAIGIVTNLGAGLSEAPVDHTQVAAQMERVIGTVRELLLTAARFIPAERSCRCSP